MRIIKFRHVTEGEWLNIHPNDRMSDTRYTIYNQDRSKILFEWQGALITTDAYNKNEMDNILKNIEINGGDI